MWFSRVGLDEAALMLFDRMPELLGFTLDLARRFSEWLRTCAIWVSMALKRCLMLSSNCLIFFQLTHKSVASHEGYPAQTKGSQP